MGGGYEVIVCGVRFEVGVGVFDVEYVVGECGVCVVLYFLFYGRG